MPLISLNKALNIQENVNAVTRKAVLGEKKPFAARGVLTSLSNAAQSTFSQLPVKQHKPEPVHRSPLKKVAEVQAIVPIVKEPAKRLNVFTCPLIKTDDGLKMELPDGVEDVDLVDGTNPQACAYYANVQYRYCHELEEKYGIVKGFMKYVQPHINERMRKCLVDWLIEVQQNFHLLQETLYVAIYILDRYLAAEKVTRDKLQLAGVTSLWIAAKYEEMCCPVVSDFIYVTDNSYTTPDMIQMELSILDRIKFEVSRPFALQFLRRLSKCAQATLLEHGIAKYVMELTLPEYKFAHIHPSEIAAGSLLFAFRVSDSESKWGEKMNFYSGYHRDDAEEVVRNIATLVMKAPTDKYQNVYKKYSKEKNQKVAKIDELLPSKIKELFQL